MPTPTAADIVKIILAACPPLSTNTRDVFHVGDGSLGVTGIAVTFQATRAVCAEAVRRGANFIITHEPTFYLDENLEQLAGDFVYESKRAFLADHKLAVWRCHDSWHVKKPDGILTGMTAALGWERFVSAERLDVFDVPATTLGALVSEVKSKLSIGGVRVVGDLSMPVRRVAFSAGCPGWPRHRMLLNQSGVDVLVAGETREWETNEYVRDSAAAGRPQGLIVLGHCNSEEAGMAYLANWLRERVTSVPIHFIPAGDPFQIL